MGGERRRKGVFCETRIGGFGEDGAKVRARGEEKAFFAKPELVWTSLRPRRCAEYSDFKEPDGMERSVLHERHRFQLEDSLGGVWAEGAAGWKMIVFRGLRGANKVGRVVTEFWRVEGLSEAKREPQAE